MKLKQINPLYYISIFLIKSYRLVSTRLPSRCRFYPSCSQYALDVLHKYGYLHAVLKIVKRISKCHPFHPGGIDKA